MSEIREEDLMTQVVCMAPAVEVPLTEEAQEPVILASITDDLDVVANLEEVKAKLKAPPQEGENLLPLAVLACIAKLCKRVTDLETRCG